MQELLNLLILVAPVVVQTWHGAFPCLQRRRRVREHLGELRDARPAAVVHHVDGGGVHNLGQGTPKATIAVGLDQTLLRGVRQEGLGDRSHHSLHMGRQHLSAGLRIHDYVIQRGALLLRPLFPASVKDLTDVNV